MSKLLIKSKKGNGLLAQVTPESAGWSYVGFELHRLARVNQRVAKPVTRNSASSS